MADVQCKSMYVRITILQRGISQTFFDIRIIREQVDCIIRNLKVFIIPELLFARVPENIIRMMFDLLSTGPESNRSQTFFLRMLISMQK